MDSLTAVLTRVVYRYCLIFQFAADQQHEVDRSKDLEGFLSLHLNAVVHESDPHRAFPVQVAFLCHAIASDFANRPDSEGFAVKSR
jgi:hypothetical protein